MRNDGEIFISYASTVVQNQLKSVKHSSPPPTRNKQRRVLKSLPAQRVGYVRITTRPMGMLLLYIISVAQKPSLPTPTPLPRRPNRGTLQGDDNKNGEMRATGKQNHPGALRLDCCSLFALRRGKSCVFVSDTAGMARTLQNLGGSASLMVISNISNQQVKKSPTRLWVCMYVHILVYAVPDGASLLLLYNADIDRVARIAQAQAAIATPHRPRHGGG